MVVGEGVEIYATKDEEPLGLSLRDDSTYRGGFAGTAVDCVCSFDMRETAIDRGYTRSIQ